MQRKEHTLISRMQPRTACSICLLNVNQSATILCCRSLPQLLLCVCVYETEVMATPEKEQCQCCGIKKLGTTNFQGCEHKFCPECESEIEDFSTFKCPLCDYLTQPTRWECDPIASHLIVIRISSYGRVPYAPTKNLTWKRSVSW